MNMGQHHKAYMDLGEQSRIRVKLRWLTAPIECDDLEVGHHASDAVVAARNHNGPAGLEPVLRCALYDVEWIAGIDS